ncbi:class I SAM-dependent methyltransferase [Cypionkella sp.]|uniref:class I SAM-dependent methyltransferase n=1 Tax=Cypionkella sp. TaxID=2811411 RepID=UPI003751C565
MTIKIDIARLEQDPVVQALKLECLKPDDLVNLVLQRSEVMFDAAKSGRVIRTWGKGELGPMQEVVERLGETLARRAAGVILQEYNDLAPLLRELAPQRVADIGCGYAFFDLFLAKELKSHVVLIDLETNTQRHFGFQAEGAAYSSLACAKTLLCDNGVDASQITTLNPTETRPETIEPVDMVLSFLSCGFHYPVDLYLPFLEKALVPGGSAIFDLRKGSDEMQVAALQRLGAVTDIPASQDKVRRVLLRKAAA